MRKFTYTPVFVVQNLLPTLNTLLRERDRDKDRERQREGEKEGEG